MPDVGTTGAASAYTRDTSGLPPSCPSEPTRTGVTKLVGPATRIFGAPAPLVAPTAAAAAVVDKVGAQTADDEAGTPP